MGGLSGCAPSAADEGADESVVAENVEAPEHESVTVRVAVPVGVQGVVEELADSYAADKEWVSFEFEVFESAKKENKALKPTIPAVPAEEDDGGVPESASTSDDEPEPAADDEAVTLLPEADLVFQNSLAAMDSAEELGVADAATRADMICDGMAIVASADSKVKSATTADIAAGSVPLAVVSGKGVHAQRQYEALEAIGVYADGAFTGYYRSNKASVRAYDSTADLFAGLAKSDEMVALVRTSDIYRYGGVKVVGAIPARMYTPMLFPHALGCNLDAMEGGEQVAQTARDFLNWISTDEAAFGIVEKWGLSFAA
ncbi:MAG: substrate-binding domain-containing protein [Coriobacteriia bacterium]|nr:substrate-binding domain-containing protein [Coriobacteriia bacterium]